MSNDRSQELRGKWWLPVRPNDKVDGVLRIGGDDELRLSLSAPLVEVDFLHALPTHDVILGQNELDLVTLHGCRTFHVFDDTLVELRADAALIGGHFPKVDEVNLHTLLVEMESLDLWLRPHEYLSVADGPEPGSKVVRPSRGAPTDLEVHWGDYQIGFKATGAYVPVPGPLDKITVQKSAHLEVRAISGEKPFGEFFKIAMREAKNRREALVRSAGLKGLPIATKVPDEDLVEVGGFFSSARVQLSALGSFLGIPESLMLTLLPKLDPYQSPGFRLKLSVERARKRAGQLTKSGDLVDSDHIMFSPYCDLMFVDKRTLGYARQEERDRPSLLPAGSTDNLRRAASVEGLLKALGQ